MAMRWLKENKTEIKTVYKTAKTIVNAIFFLFLSKLTKMNFQEYNEQNPTVYPRFLKIAIETHSKGFKRYSAKAILEVVRYFTSVAENGGKFKINNNVTPMFARQAVKDRPELNGFFELRRSKFDNRIND
jgi:hypothetical protein